MKRAIGCFLIVVMLAPSALATEQREKRWHAKSVVSDFVPDLVIRGLEALAERYLPKVKDQLTPQENFQKSSMLLDLADKQRSFVISVNTLRNAMSHRKPDKDPEWTAMKDARQDYVDTHEHVKRAIEALDRLIRARNIFAIGNDLADEVPDLVILQDNEIEVGLKYDKVQTYLRPNPPDLRQFQPLIHEPLNKPNHRVVQVVV